MGIPEDEREQDMEKILEEIVTENFPHLGKEIDQRFPNLFVP